MDFLPYLLLFVPHLNGGDVVGIDFSRNLVLRALDRRDLDAIGICCEELSIIKSKVNIARIL